MSLGGVGQMLKKYDLLLKYNTFLKGQNIDYVIYGRSLESFEYSKPLKMANFWSGQNPAIYKQPF